MYRHNILYCKRFRLRGEERPGIAFPREAWERGVLDGFDGPFLNHAGILAPP